MKDMKIERESPGPSGITEEMLKIYESIGYGLATVQEGIILKEASKPTVSWMKKCPRMK